MPEELSGGGICNRHKEIVLAAMERNEKKRQVSSLAIVSKYMKISNRCKKLRKKNCKYFQTQVDLCSEGGDII